MLQFQHRRLARDANRAPMLGSGGWSERQANAQARRDAFLQDQADPHKSAIRRCRAAADAVRAVKAEAAKIHTEVNALVTCPSSGKPASVHPTRAHAVAAFLASIGASSDPSQPVAPVRSLQEIEAGLNADALAEKVAADAALTEIEGQADDEADHIPVVFAPSPVRHMPVETTPEPRKRGRPPKALADVLAAEGALNDE